MSKEYVVQHEGKYRIAETRVSLDSIVYAFRRGTSPESIQRSYPSLTLEQICGAITFYLSHQEEIDNIFSTEKPRMKSCAQPHAQRTQSFIRNSLPEKNH
jgi:uncharacterized protein (DUF433 family)